MASTTGKASRPGRPLGVSLAIFASVLLFSVIPLLQVGMILLVERQIQRANPVIPFSEEGDLDPIATGGDFRGGVADERLILQIALGIAFLIVAVFAWRGRPAQIRFIFVGAVLLLTGITMILTFLPATTGGGLSGGSLDDLINSVLCRPMAISLLVALYVVWYLNRGPARAFYRGYYLPDPETGEQQPRHDAADSPAGRDYRAGTS
jgi:hypothetical protein